MSNTYIYVNSYDKTNGTDTDFISYVNISGPTLADKTEVALSQLIITNSIYNVDSSNNKFNFREESNGTIETATINPGSYSLAQLLPVLKTAMDNSSENSRTYTLTSSTITNKITISSNVGTFSVCPDNGEGLNLMLGFSRFNETSQSATQIAPRIYNLSRYGNLLLYCSVIEGNNYNTSSGTTDQILESIPLVESNSGDIFVYEPVDLNWRKLGQQGKINQLRFVLRDATGNTIDLNGGYMSLVLKLK